MPFAGFHRRFQRTLDAAAEGDAFSQLLGDVFDERALESQDGILPRSDDAAADQVLQFALQTLDLGPLAADDHTRTSRVRSVTFTSSRVRSISTFGMPANRYLS